MVSHVLNQALPGSSRYASLSISRNFDEKSLPNGRIEPWLTSPDTDDLPHFSFQVGGSYRVSSRMTSSAWNVGSHTDSSPRFCPTHTG